MWDGQMFIIPSFFLAFGKGNTHLAEGWQEICNYINKEDEISHHCKSSKSGTISVLLTTEFPEPSTMPGTM